VPRVKAGYMTAPFQCVKSIEKALATRAVPHMGPAPATPSACPLRRAWWWTFARRHTLEACRPGFFLPVRVLSRLFRRLFLQELQAAFVAGQLGLFGDLAHLADPAAFRQRLDQLRRTDWVVYAKPPFGGPEQVLTYLGRYTHRIAIANSRLISLADGKVSFSWKNYRRNRKAKVLTLDAGEFMRRFLLHTLPDGFHRIRHYGFLANGGRSDKIALCRQLLAVRHLPPDPVADPLVKCEIPACGGTMRRVDVIPRACARDHPFRCDTS
jgi:Putative transposase